MCVLSNRKKKEAAFTVIWMTTDTQLRGRETKGNVVPLPPTHTVKKGNSIDRKPRKKTLKSVKEILKCSTP